MLFLFFMIFFILLIFSNNLLLLLLLLEILSFYIIYFLCVSTSSQTFSDFLLLFIFCVFVIEGVIALSGLIMLVSSVGSDYMQSSTIIKI